MGTLPGKITTFQLLQINLPIILIFILSLSSRSKGEIKQSSPVISSIRKNFRQGSSNNEKFIDWLLVTGVPEWSVDFSRFENPSLWNLCFCQFVSQAIQLPKWSSSCENRFIWIRPTFWNRCQIVIQSKFRRFDFCFDHFIQSYFRVNFVQFQFHWEKRIQWTRWSASIVIDADIDRYDQVKAGFRPYSEIIGNLRTLQKIYGHSVERQKWRLQTVCWRVGVF